MKVWLFMKLIRPGLRPSAPPKKEMKTKTHNSVIIYGSNQLYTQFYYKYARVHIVAWDFSITEGKGSLL